MTLKGQTRNPITLREQYLENYLSYRDFKFDTRLRSASNHKVSVPRHRLSTYGRRAFAVAGPTVSNSLPEDMRDPDVSEDSYRQSLKTFLFSQYWCVQRIRGFFYKNVLYKFTVDIDIDIFQEDEK